VKTDGKKKKGARGNVRFLKKYLKTGCRATTIKKRTEAELGVLKGTTLPLEEGWWNLCMGELKPGDNLTHSKIPRTGRASELRL